MNVNQLLFGFACSAMLFSCTSEDIPNMSDEKALETRAFTNEIFFDKDANMLSFESQEDFKLAVEKVKNIQSYGEEINNIIPILEEEKTLQIEGFTSIYDSYVSALNEADNYYDTEAHYKEFKSKYSTLYFPEYNNDYSVYLPVSDKNVAKLLNSEGNVMIDGEVINMKDVSSYEQLTELGETIDDEGIVTFATDEYLNGTPEIKEGKHKLKVKVYTKPGSSGVYQSIVVDVSFRKKGFLGIWYNRKGKTTLGWVNGASWSKHKFSSHDYEFARVYTGSTPVPFKGDMYVTYDGFGDKKINFRVDI